MRFALFITAFVFLASLAMAQEQKKFLALGDSYTIGESVAESDRWPVQLVKALNEKGLNYAMPDIIATTGWRTDDLKNAILKKGPSNEYDLVSLLIGVNNQYQGKTVKDYEPEFEELLKMAIGFVGGDTAKVIVVSIPDYGFTPFGKPNQQKISKEIDEYNEVNQRIADHYKVRYFPITDITRRGLAEPDLVATDGLHPSGKCYSLWVERIMASEFFK